MKTCIIFFMLVTQGFCWGMESLTEFPQYTKQEIYVNIEDLKKIFNVDDEADNKLQELINYTIDGMIKNQQCITLITFIKDKMQEAGNKAALSLALNKIPTFIEFHIKSKLNGVRAGSKKENEFKEFLTKTSKNPFIENINKALKEYQPKELSLFLEYIKKLVIQEIPVHTSEKIDVINQKITKSLIEMLICKQISAEETLYYISDSERYIALINTITAKVKNEINEYKCDQKIHIIKSEAKTCLADFTHTQKNFAIRLKLADIFECPFISALQQNEKRDYVANEKGDCKLQKQKADLPTILTHELIHMAHFIEDQETFAKDRASMVGGYWDLASWNTNSQEFYRLWQDVEEQRTVIGKEGKEDICELTIRYDAKLPIRYPYLTIEDNSVKKEIIDKIFNNYHFQYKFIN